MASRQTWGRRHWSPPATAGAGAAAACAGAAGTGARAAAGTGARAAAGAACAECGFDQCGDREPSATGPAAAAACSCCQWGDREPRATGPADAAARSCCQWECGFDQCGCGSAPEEHSTSNPRGSNPPGVDPAATTTVPAPTLRKPTARGPNRAVSSNHARSRTQRLKDEKPRHGRPVPWAVPGGHCPDGSKPRVDDDGRALGELCGKLNRTGNPTNVGPFRLGMHGTPGVAFPHACMPCDSPACGGHR